MKIIAPLLLAAAGCAAAGSAFAQPPASEPAPKPAMRSMSPKTAPDMAVLPPTRATDVWVNTSSGVYHCPGNRWYGRTPKGTYMSEADAKAKRYKPDSAQGCS